MRRAATLIGLTATAALLLATPAYAACGNEATREDQHSTYLPDCRAYEMVSPPYKEGFGAIELSGVSEDGSRVLLTSFGNFSNLEHVSPIGQRYELARGGTGWPAAPLEFPQFSVYFFEGISPDFQSTLLTTVTFAGPPHHESNVFIKKEYLDLLGASPVPLGPLAAPAAEGHAMGPLAASQDLRRSVYFLRSPNCQSGETDALWPGDTTECGGLFSLYEYEYTGVENTEPSLVGISDEGRPASIAASHLISDCGTYLGSFPEGDTYNAISAGGNAVFFTAAASSSCGVSGPPVNEVYARLREAPPVPAHTVAISEPTTGPAGDCSACHTASPADALFAGASNDGSKVFFTTTQELLGEDGTRNLYLYDFNASDPHQRIAEVSATADPEGARVQGVARVSQDGSRVYFVAQGVLTEGPNAEGGEPTAGQDNLYVIDTATGHTTFIATLSPADGADWSSTDVRPVQATPDGRFLVFQSVADLTPDQNGLPEAGQLFRYDAQAEVLVRVSRSAGGINEDGNSSEYAAAIPTQYNIFQEQPPGGDGHFNGLALSADGSRVFFSSQDALTPQALGGAVNVYQYRAGQVSLISDGHDAALSRGRPAVRLLGTDESGRDVFFTTADRLLPQDTDNQLDVYDARLEGGFPLLAPPHCQGEACQGAQAQPPAAESPATQGFNGPENPNSTHPKKHHKHHRKRQGHRANTDRGGSQ
jgi:hypothetical protein